MYIMNISIILGFITLIFLWYNFYISILIVKYLKSKGEDVSLFNKSGFYIKGKIFKYLPLYKQITITNEGKIGSLFYQFYISFIFFILFLILGIISVSN